MENADCVSCADHMCREGVDCYNIAESTEHMYNNASPLDKNFLRCAAKVESKGYMRWPRALEIIHFAETAGLSHLGLAFCIGLAEEAKIFKEMISNRFSVSSVCCKVGGINKSIFDLEQIRPDRSDEIMCSPFGQAQILNRAKTDLNVIIGLCVGHDALFTKHSKAPVTTLVTKDRILGHNPATALYSRYWKRILLDNKTKS